MKSEKAIENLLSEESLQQYKLNPYRKTPRSFEPGGGEHLTVPDQTLTIKQILERHTRGLRTPDQNVGYYDEHNDPLNLNGVNIETLDLSEKYNILHDVRQKTRTMKQQYENQLKSDYEKTIRDKAIAEEQERIKNTSAKTENELQH